VERVRPVNTGTNIVPCHTLSPSTFKPVQSSKFAAAPAKVWTCNAALSRRRIRVTLGAFDANSLPRSFKAQATAFFALSFQSRYFGFDFSYGVIPSDEQLRESIDVFRMILDEPPYAFF